MTWTEQVKNKKVQNLSLSYVPLKEATPNTMSIEPIVESIYVSYIIEINSINASQDLNSLVILY